MTGSGDGGDARSARLVAELQHRVRSTLSLVRAVARRTAEHSSSVEDFAAHLDGRLAAIARVQGAVVRDPFAGIDLRSLLLDELALHSAREGERVRIDGADLKLRPKSAELMALVFHELCSNAAKFGALGRGGTLDVAWDIEDGWLLLDWMEANVSPPVEEQRRVGFGLDLVEQGLPHQFGGETAVAFTPRGIDIRMRLPAAQVLEQPAA